MRNQPVSQFSLALRGLADGTADPRLLLPSLLWLGALIGLVGWMSVRVSGRRA